MSEQKKKDVLEKYYHDRNTVKGLPTLEKVGMDNSINELNHLFLEEFLGMLPRKKKDKSGYYGIIAEGFNRCRQLIQDRIKERYAGTRSV